jgi:nucleotide-binding universal stress UspA family protein
MGAAGIDSEVTSMKALLAIDDDERYEGLLSSLWNVLSLGENDEVIVAHVVATLRWTLPPPEVFRRVDEFLDSTAGRIRERGIAASPLRLDGDVAEELMLAARKHDVDLMVLGAFGQARTQDFLVGSVAEKVESLADRDLLMVRDPLSENGVRALLAVDGSKASLGAVRSFASLVPSEGTRVRLLHVVEVPPALAIPPPYQERADEALSSASSLLASKGFRVEPLLSRGSAAASILDEAKSFQATLIGVGAHGMGRPALPSVWRGTVAKRIARHAPCSVLIADSESKRLREET